MPFVHLRKAYLAAVVELHPDRNTDPKAAEQLAIINACWTQISSEIKGEKA